MATRVSIAMWLLAASAAGCEGTYDEPHEDEIRACSSRRSRPPRALRWWRSGASTLAGSDRSRATAAPLENGAPGNLFGGLGSALAYVGGDTFLALPDRGPKTWSRTRPASTTRPRTSRAFTRCRCRCPKSREGDALPLTLTPTLEQTTLLFDRDPLVYGTGEGFGVKSGVPALNDAQHFYFTGRSDNFDPSAPSTNLRNARLDPEGIRVLPDGRRVYVCNETDRTSTSSIARADDVCVRSRCRASWPRRSSHRPARRRSPRTRRAASPTAAWKVWPSPARLMRSASIPWSCKTVAPPPATRASWRSICAPARSPSTPTR